MVGSHFPPGGRDEPPHTYYLYRCPPWGISVPAPFLIVLLFFLFLLFIRLFPALCGLVGLLPLVSPSGGGGDAASYPCVLPPSSSSADAAPVSTPLHLAPRVRTCYLRGAGACPLGGPPPGVVFIKLETILCTCSYGTSLPCTGGGAPSPITCPVRPALHPIVVGVPCLALFSSLFLYPLRFGGCSPLSFRCAMREELALLFGGCPPLPFLFEGCHTLTLSLPQVVREECALMLGGCPTLLRPMDAFWGCPLPGQGVPSTTWLHTGGVHC